MNLMILNSDEWPDLKQLVNIFCQKLNFKNETLMTYRLNFSPDLIAPKKQELLGEHALVAISTFNSYFSVENMEKLFFWTHQNYADFNVFVMDGASKFNLMAMGYDDQKASKKTRKQDNNMKNKVFKSLTCIGFSLEESEKKLLLLSKISKKKEYAEVYKNCIKFFEENNFFREDCLNATRALLSSKIQNVTDDNLYLAVKYLFLELPVWLNTPYILKVNSSTFIYKDLSSFWQKI